MCKKPLRSIFALRIYETFRSTDHLIPIHFNVKFFPEFRTQFKFYGPTTSGLFHLTLKGL
ncbi:MAG: hypothetical protein BWK80_52805 [Desulfobacteraceae bacterium IS3]|nr:MAG: hypothetical protein BWK80_52805 [Desulfobacteraceae bacterium IS3]